MVDNLLDDTDKHTAHPWGSDDCLEIALVALAIVEKDNFAEDVTTLISKRKIDLLEFELKIDATQSLEEGF